MFQYAYPHPALTVDIILISNHLPQQILLIQRLHDPFANQWAFPGGFVEENEDLSVAASRELKEETGILISEIQQFKTYGTPNRDPRGHTVSVVFWAEVDSNTLNPKAADDAGNAAWFDVSKLPPLAFDHYQIVSEFLSFHATLKSIDETPIFVI